MNYINAQHAFEYLYDKIILSGEVDNGTKAIYNTGFYILNPVDNIINTTWRKWNKEYADFEWDWYMSGNPNADAISNRAKIWKSCQDAEGNVNSNYGFQWNRNGQIDYVVNELKNNPNSRRAAISIYDGKEHDKYSKDTPCTYAIWFELKNGNLNMSVMMRSNDLVFGFCNDQYCFSKLQQLIANKLQCGIGTYYHFVNNLHIYERHYNLKK
mgnify:CR=1 FL=1